MSGGETPSEEAGPLPLVGNDIVLPFQIESQAARGKLVRLGGTVDRIVSRRNYPAPVATLLGELAVLAALVSSALKYDGVLTVQVKGDGPVRMLVADATSAGEIRAYAAFDPAALDRATSGDWRTAPVPLLLGAGYLAFTIDRGFEVERYQGIVELSGRSIADCAHRHFRESDQNQAAFRLAVARTGPRGAWRAGGMMMQRLPDSGPARLSGDAPDDELEESWRRAVVLMGSCTPAELVDDRLHPHDLLYRLFHEDGVRVFEPHGLAHGCRCSRDRVEATLRSFPREEIEDLEIDGEVVVTCEFCGARYAFDDPDIDLIYRTN
ncbi:MAG: Hsp33 family molecular chaperone HslO [Defluviicoccus sp.]|nr:Hsp33 family molecular chaperone HslO [Defluviicoccus sp.]